MPYKNLIKSWFRVSKESIKATNLGGEASKIILLSPSSSSLLLYPPKSILLSSDKGI